MIIALSVLRNDGVSFESIAMATSITTFQRPTILHLSVNYFCDS